jgi:hypothetical protein
MGRAIGGAVLGYIVMVVVIFCGMTAAWYAVGADGAFMPGNFDVSPTWAVISIVVGIIAALAGGRVSRMIAKTITGPRILAGLVIVLGLLSAIPGLSMDPVSPTRDATLPMFEAMAQARTPLWALILNPIIGAIGALIGGNALSKN